MSHHRHGVGGAIRLQFRFHSIQGSTKLEGSRFLKSFAFEKVTLVGGKNEGLGGQNGSSMRNAFYTSRCSFDILEGYGVLVTG